MLAWRSQDGRSVHLHTSLRWTSDFADKFSTDPSLFVYDAYARIDGIPSNTDLYVGRQFVYVAGGNALIDGGRIRFRHQDKLSLDFFGGSSVSSEDPERMRSIGDYLVVGGRLGTRALRKIPLGLNWMLRRRDGEESFHRVGLDAAALFESSELYGRGFYNVASERLAEILVRGIHRRAGWYLSAEYVWREPMVASSSIFSVVDFDRYQLGRLEVRREVWRRLSVAAHAQGYHSGGDDSWRTGIGVVGPGYSLSWIRQTGYAGNNDGVSGYLSQPLGKSLVAHVTANLFRYRVQREQIERSDAYASTAGVRWRAGAGITVLAEAQYLRNALSEDDFRGLLRISKDFSMSSRGEEP